MYVRACVRSSAGVRMYLCIFFNVVLNPHITTTTTATTTTNNNNNNINNQPGLLRVWGNDNDIYF